MILCLVCGVMLGLMAVGIGQQLSFGWQSFSGVISTLLLASYRRGKRFQQFEELFPEAIDT